VSHLPERKEKVCLNCNARLEGLYCHICGQENREPRETVWGLITHFFYDITHFDGKFFTTIRYLLLKPGFLSREYIMGRRASHLNPIRMYVFTSAFFFLIFFNFIYKGDTKVVSLKDVSVIKSHQQAVDSTSARLARLQARADTVNAIFKQQIKEQIEDRKSELDKMQQDTAYWRQLFDPLHQRMQLGGRYYTTPQEYDSVQKSLPSAQRDGFIMGTAYRKSLEIKMKSADAGFSFDREISARFFKHFPQMFFISLPLFALLLKLLYLRRKYFYVEHGIFTIHYYCATFIFMLLGYLLMQIPDWPVIGFIGTLFSTLLVVYGLLYLYLAMRRFYQQGWGKTLAKFVLLNLATLIVMTILMFIFLIFSAMEI
jgi:Protein of unknown function (DUF3667)